MAKVTFKLEGAAELRRRLHEFGPQFVTNVSGRALRAGAKPITTLAKNKVAVETGALKKSITTRLRRYRDGMRTIEMGFRKPVSRRAHLTEYGTRHSAAQPFMRPALDEGAGAAFEAVLSTLRVGIEIEARKRGLISDDSDDGE